METRLITRRGIEASAAIFFASTKAPREFKSKYMELNKLRQRSQFCTGRKNQYRRRNFNQLFLV